ncbi:putative cellulose-binding GDSL lipase/acylhydrolase [Lasiosphaeria hispida]|uniref:Cellulose-binding GDSL lipase/acylhydrolase n=1 Tax=Lasiosphaeria hispida TaxID=260671 RepID=A0AAJ0HC40_9PEZI|nr:putative cellulose-binding GDSL lipase/acylhydrolase [Lasiosphaeria hispida]
MVSALTLLATVPALAAGAKLYGQCGGIGYRGPTDCPRGAVCAQYSRFTPPPAPPGPGPKTTSISSLAATPTQPATVPATSAVPASTAIGSSVKYLIAFGDSYSQTGFDIASTKPSASNPLGNPALPGWTASGGLNWVGFLASQFNATTLLTYNFAYGGATTNASLVVPWKPEVLSLVDQVAQFSGSIASHPAYAPWTAADSLFAVWIGVNDVGNSWWLGTYDELLGKIMDSYFGQLQILYNAGARNFALLTVPPIQKTPTMQEQTAESQAGEAVSIGKYNAAIAARLAAFKTANAGITATVIDTTIPFDTALANPTAYGSPNATCYNGDGVSCLWFNDYHPGVAINKLVAGAVAEAWKGSFFK